MAIRLTEEPHLLPLPIATTTRSPWDEQLHNAPKAGSKKLLKGNAMLHYAVIFLIIAIIAGFFGFAGIAGTSAWIAHVLFVLFLVLFIVSLIFRGRPSA